MKILVTGDAGFIASRVKLALENKGYKVFGYDIVRGQDILDLKGLENAVKEVDVIFHIAAQADLTQMAGSIESGRIGVLRNVEATHNVAYSCAKHKKWLIYASTVCIYGNTKNHPAIEDVTLPNPSELYACSKYAAEWIVRGYGKNYGMPWTIQRFATIYGPGMRSALGLHIFFKQAMKGVPITLHGDGNQDRTLTYVDDLIDGIIAPLKYPESAKNQVFNLTNSYAISAKQMAEDVIKIVGSNSKIINFPQRENQIMHEDFDVSKARKLLDWGAKTVWEKGLRKTYEWMRTEEMP